MPSGNRNPNEPDCITIAVDQPSFTARYLPTALVGDGSIYHPYRKEHTVLHAAEGFLRSSKSLQFQPCSGMIFSELVLREKTKPFRMMRWCDIKGEKYVLRAKMCRVSIHWSAIANTKFLFCSCRHVYSFPFPHSLHRLPSLLVTSALPCQHTFEVFFPFPSAPYC